MQYQNTSSLIFPPIKPLPEILGDSRTRDEVLQQIHQEPETLSKYRLLTPSEQEALLEFCIGNRSLKITYDPFFHKIFHPVAHPNRLSNFISAILNQKVIVRSVLPREGIRLSAESSLMIMDIIVELTDGSLVNVEMQKTGYNFPIERTFCYGSDLLVRQYDHIRSSTGDSFSYKDMQPVFVIVLMEKSPAFFAQKPNHYIHRSQFQLDSNIPIKNLLNFIYIPLDIFLQIPHNELTELEAWLYFLASDNPLHIQRIVEKYPFFKDLYRDIIAFRYHPKELISMFSESLLIADRNTVNLMIDELRQELKETIAEKAKVISEMDDTISKMDNTISEMDKAISEKEKTISEKDKSIAEKDKSIAEKDKSIAEKDKSIAEKDAEIARLKAALAEKL